MTVQDVRTTLEIVGRCGDDMDETLISKELTEKAAHRGHR